MRCLMPGNSAVFCLKSSQFISIQIRSVLNHLEDNKGEKKGGIILTFLTMLPPYILWATGLSRYKQRHCGRFFKSFKGQEVTNAGYKRSAEA